MKRLGPSKIILILFLLIFNFWFFAKETQAVSLSDIKFPRLANLFLKTPISQSEAESLSKWDLVILGVQAQDTDPEVFDILRSNNPNIIILAYVAPTEFPVARLDTLESENGPWHKLYEGIDNSWWLLEEAGTHVSFWPGNWALNVTDYAQAVNGERWNSYYARFLEEEVMAQGFWDGIFFDSVWDSASWVNGGNIDLDRNGVRDSASQIDAAWRAGMAKIFSETRRRLGREVILIGNGGDYYDNYLNGRMFESFPNSYEGAWEGQMPKYFNFLEEGQSPQILVINGDTQNTGRSGNYQDVRFALASTLLGDGFFSYDWGTENHSQLWWYDEFEAVLGDPMTAPYNLYDYNSQEIKAGLWRRDFEKAIVLVNSLGSAQTIELENYYKRISGTQDLGVNNGGYVKTLTLNSYDGIILLKKFETVIGQSFINLSETKIFNKLGQEVRNGFISYTDKVGGGNLTLICDLEGDGRNETITASANQILIYKNDGGLRTSFYPYTVHYSGKINFACGDLDGDGILEIVTGTGFGGGPQVRIFYNNGVLKHPGFFAYPSFWRIGVHVTLGDLNGDGRAEIITAPAGGGGPHVRIFSGGTGQLINPGFFAYDERWRMGVNIAVGDIDGDTRAEIVTSAAPGGGPHVRIFDARGNLESTGFFAYDQANRDGIRVATEDVDEDGVDEILVSKSDPDLDFY